MRWHAEGLGSRIVARQQGATHQNALAFGVQKFHVATFDSLDAGIEKINVEERNAQLSTVNITLSVRDRTHLARIMRRLRNIPSVTGLSRVRH